MSNKSKNQKSEYGGAGVKLALVLVGLFVIAYAGFNYVPVAYEAESFKQDMQTAVVQGMAPSQGMTIIDSVKARIQRAMVSNNVPRDAVVQVKQNSNNVEAHVTYVKKVQILPFGIYKYNYNFDHTATPTGFLTKE